MSKVLKSEYMGLTANDTSRVHVACEEARRVHEFRLAVAKQSSLSNRVN